MYVDVISMSDYDDREDESDEGAVPTRQNRRNLEFLGIEGPQNRLYREELLTFWRLVIIVGTLISEVEARMRGGFAHRHTSMNFNNNKFLDNLLFCMYVCVWLSLVMSPNGVFLVLCVCCKLLVLQ